MKLIICGDLSVTDYSRSAFESQDTQAAFGKLLPLFSSADRVAVNLECALTESENRIKKLGPNLKGPLTTADTLKAAGITDCMLSNNHIFDFGKKGVSDTLAQLTRVGLGFTGYGQNDTDSRQNMVIEQNDIRLSIINVCEHEYTYATDRREGARPFDEFETMEDIRQAKKDADHVIVIYHGGKEHCRYPSPRLLKACREMVRCGASLVICQHSHCIGCCEDFEGGHILYGEGNFHFPKYKDDEGWNTGLIASLDVTKKSISVSYIPIGSTECGIDLLSEEKANQIMLQMNKRNQELASGAWIEGWRAFCQSVREQYYAFYAGVYGSQSHYSIHDGPAQYQPFAHYLDCEAHTDVWRELFKTYNHTNELE